MESKQRKKKSPKINICTRTNRHMKASKRKKKKKNSATAQLKLSLKSTNEGHFLKKLINLYKITYNTLRSIHKKSYLNEWWNARRQTGQRCEVVCWRELRRRLADGRAVMCPSRRRWEGTIGNWRNRRMQYFNNYYFIFSQIVRLFNRLKRQMNPMKSEAFKINDGDLIIIKKFHLVPNLKTTL